MLESQHKFSQMVNILFFDKDIFLVITEHLFDISYYDNIRARRRPAQIDKRISEKRRRVMTKSYDLSKSSDVRAFHRDMESAVRDITREAVVEDGVDYECPICGGTFHAVQGECKCENCGSVIAVNFDFSNL